MAPKLKIKAPKAKPKLNKTNIKSPIGSLGDGIGSPAGKKFKSSTLSNQFKNQPVLQAPKIDKSPVNTNPIAGVSQTLAETNSILVEIQNQLALDFADRIANEQDEIRKLKAQKSKKRQADAAGSSGLGAAAGMAIGGPIGAVVGDISERLLGVFAPIIGVFKKIATFFMLVAAGFVANQGLDWLTNNWQHVEGFFNFMGEHGHKILMGLTFGIAGILGYKFIKAGIKVAKFLKRVFRLARVFIKRTMPRMFKNTTKAIKNGLNGIKGAGKGIFGFIKNIGKGLFGAGKSVAKLGVKKGATKGVAKVAAKSVGKGVGKSFLKKIPVIGLGLGAIFAIDRLRKGDWGGALMELGSGAASMIPGVGTAVSVGMDAALIGKDINDAKKESGNVAEVSGTTDGDTQSAKLSGTTENANISSLTKSRDLGPVESSGGIVNFPTAEIGGGDDNVSVANAASGGDSLDVLDPDDLSNFYINFSRDTYGVVA